MRGFFSSRVVQRVGPSPRYGVRNDDLGAGEPVTVTEIGTSAWWRR